MTWATKVATTTAPAGSPVSAGTDALFAYGVTDPAQPRALACHDLRGAGGVQAMAVADRRVYVATTLSGLFVLSISE